MEGLLDDDNESGSTIYPLLRASGRQHSESDRSLHMFEKKK